jgi:hypothetical protein
MDAEPRENEGRSDPLTARPDRGDAGDFARWESQRDRDEAEFVRWDEGSDSNPSASGGPGACLPGAADRTGTVAAYDGHRRRFIASGGAPSRFDSLHLLAAARIKAKRILNVLGAAAGEEPRDATEDEVRVALNDMTNEAIEAQGRGRFRAFRRMLWPFGPPLHD